MSKTDEWNVTIDKAIERLKEFVEDSPWTPVHDALDMLDMLPKLYTGEPIQELCLCEHAQIIPRPGKLYRFTVDKTCAACNKLAEAYK